MTISGRSAKALVIALTASVLLNFVAIGFAGSMLGGALVLRSLARQAEAPFPEALRAGFRGNVVAHRRELFLALRDFRDARERQQAAFTAPTFDRAAAEAAQADVRAAGERVVVILQSAMLDSVAGLPDSTRRTLPAIPFGLRPLRSVDTPDTGGS